MKRHDQWLSISRACVLALVAALVACAPEVTRRPTTLVPASESSVTIRVAADTSVTLDTNYIRLLRRDSRWRVIGNIPEGTVYRPADQVLTVEGAHVHEAWIVVQERRLVGFYLPVEKTFSPLERTLQLEITQKGD